jgi:prepilin-type processing-associated H-X9-DG protein
LKKEIIVKYKRAVTKGEFLVTLVCIIFALLNFGALNSAGRERARRMVCVANIARLAQANHIYANNWDEQFCPPMMEDMTMPSGPTDERKKSWIINNDFRKYMAFDKKQTVTWSTHIPAKEYQCPSNILFKKSQYSFYDFLGSYAYNVTDWNGGHPTHNIECFWNACCSCCTSVGASTWQIGWKRTEVKYPSEKINFVESNDWWAKWSRGANYVKGWDILGQAPSHHSELPDYAAFGMWGSTLYRHNEGANFAFYDGHVEYLPKEKAFVDTDGDLTDYDTQDATDMWYVLYPD